MPPPVTEVVLHVQGRDVHKLGGAARGVRRELVPVEKELFYFDNSNDNSNVCTLTMLLRLFCQEQQEGPQVKTQHSCFLAKIRINE